MFHFLQGIVWNNNIYVPQSLWGRGPHLQLLASVNYCWAIKMADWKTSSSIVHKSALTRNLISPSYGHGFGCAKSLCLYFLRVIKCFISNIRTHPCVLAITRIWLTPALRKPPGVIATPSLIPLVIFFIFLSYLLFPWVILFCTGYWVAGQAGGCFQNCGMHLKNRWTDFLCSKFYGIVYTRGCAMLWSFAHLPHMSLPMVQTLVTFGAIGAQTLRNVSLKPLHGFTLLEVLWNCSCVTSWSLSHFPHMALLMGRKKLVKSGTTGVEILQNPYISETTSWIQSIRSSMEWSRLLVLQLHHNHLLVCPMWKYQ